MFEDYEYFKREVYALTKIDLNCYKERQMKRRIDSLIQQNKIDSYSEYIRAIRANKDMFEAFVDYLTINVSEFYRNPELWTVLEKEILPKMIYKNRSLRVWSAACSTGDEPYSLVMAMNQYLPTSQISIIATDLDKRVLEKAKCGLYNERSLKGLPKTYLDRYFYRVGEGNYRISDDVKKCVDFRTHDLLKDPYPSDCDLVVCRNVMIYFTEEVKDKIYHKFSNCLKKDGFLFVGSTEQIIQPRDFGFRTYQSFFYQKHIEED